MGCDIHLLIEARDKEKNQWVGVSGQLGLGRNYEAFAALAGVRGDGPDPEGTPEDISQTGEYYVRSWNSDGHSHSHLAIKEFCKRWMLVDEPDQVAELIRQEIERVAGYSSATAWVREYERLFGYYMDDSDEYRVVFWFDN